MRLLSASAMYSFPSVPTATPTGWSSSALVAGPLSPVSPQVPLPATVEMLPVLLVYLRITQLVVSAT